MAKMNQEAIDEFIRKYENLYFIPVSKKEKEQKLGKVRLTGTERKVEECLFPNDRIEKCSNIEPLHIAWKAGRLTSDMLKKESVIPPLNGYGKSIDNLDMFLNKVNEKCSEIQSHIEEDNKDAAIQVLIDCKNELSVKYLGSVYLLAILFFLSGGQYPVYDKYAHTAVKALYFEKEPKDIFVGEAEQKKDDRIKGMYDEYCWFLEQVFGTHTITRNVDRALWVYGHKSI